jgi:tetratricopeptide (TPR) repeat protein
MAKMPWRRCGWFSLFLLLAAGIAIGGWYEWPSRRRSRRLDPIQKALAANHWVKAEKLLRQWFQDHPADTETQFLYVQVLRRLGRLSEAEVALLKAVQLGLSEPEGRREYALIEARQDFRIAEGALQHLLKERPDDGEVLQALAEGYAQDGHWREAERVYTDWLVVEPERLASYFERGRARLESRQFAAAAGDFRQVLQRSPRHFQARLFLAHCLLSTAQMADAEAELLLCWRLRPDRSEPLVGLAACALERGAPDRAQQLLTEALELDPSSLLVLHEQGNLYLRRQRYDRALSLYEHILRLEPRDWLAHLKLAQITHRQGNVERARNHLRWYEELHRAATERPGRAD